ncbi:hypothetical protein FHG87_009906 [Trinorchestia longiramus]|nr:hypothetical protein FHG87_009906 [Trinorchestia longiramus]
MPQLPGSTQKTCCQLPIQEKHNTASRRNRTTTETRTDLQYLCQNSKTRHATNKPTTAHTNINKSNTHQTRSSHNRSTHGSTRQNKKFEDILTESLKLNFNIDTTFPDRDSTAIFNFYYDKTNSQLRQMTQTAPKEEHTIDQTIDTAMDETDKATYTEIRQKRQISDGMEDFKLLMDNIYTTYVKLYRNYEHSSPIPDNPINDWFANELDKDQDNDRGLKLFTQDWDHQPVVEMLRRRRALFLHTKMNIKPHEQFITLPRYHTTTTTIKNTKHTSEK